MYKDLEVSFQKTQDSLKEEVSYTQDCLEYFYKYQTLEHHGLKELGTTKSLWEKGFKKKEQALEAKKEKLYKSKDFGKWELNATDLNRIADLSSNVDESYKLMLPKET